MPYDKYRSPVGWYYASYLLRFVELEDRRKNQPDRRFVAWENTVLVQATSLGAAYAKVERVARAASRPYRGGPNGVKVQWEYIGVTELLPIYEKLADGSEIAWTEHKPRTLKTLKSWVRSKAAFRQ